MAMDDAYAECNTLGNIIEYAAPQKAITMPSSLTIGDPWMTCGPIKSSRTLNKLRYDGKSKSDAVHDKFITFKNVYNKLKKTARQEHYKNVSPKHKYDIKKKHGVIFALNCHYLTIYAILTLQQYSIETAPLCKILEQSDNYS